MPFVSQRQRRFLHVAHPEIAQKWEAEAKQSGRPAVQPKRKKLVSTSS